MIINVSHYFVSKIWDYYSLKLKISMKGKKNHFAHSFRAILMYGYEEFVLVDIQRRNY